MLWLVTKLGIVHIWGVLTSKIKIPLQELGLKIGGGLTCEGGVIVGFYGMWYSFCLRERIKN